jgi:dTDP-4-amino-4,6-dideoxygalactose transaminase
MEKMVIPFLSLKDITSLHGNEIHEAISRVVDSGWYLQGEAVRNFEEEYAHFIGTQHCVSCANGLDALTLMLRAYIELGRLRKGDEVIVPANTYIATILAITENNRTPILVEPNYETLQINPSLIKAKITERTRAIMLVHLYGRLAYTEEIATLCKKNDLLLFEDNAQAHGCRYNDKRTGSLGDCAAHSFYPGKNLGALGDAGAVTTNDATVAEIIRSLGNYGSSRKYVFPYQGRNSRMDEIQATILSVKLRHLDRDNALRQRIAADYYENINNPNIVLPQRTDNLQNVYHLFPILCEHRDNLQQYLQKAGIQTVIHYPIPPHKQACYKDWNTMQLPITERIAQEELSLPISPTMTTEQVAYVIKVINNYNTKHDCSLH